MAFVKVVEGSEIYNFPIHHLVHFYSKFWIFSRSNKGSVKRCRASPALGVRATAPPEAARRPRPHLPRPPCTPRRLEVRTQRASPPFAPYRARRGPCRPLVRPRLPSPVRAPTEAAAVPRPDLRHPLSRARESRLFKGLPPPRACHACAATTLTPPPRSSFFHSWSPLLEHAHVTMSAYRSFPDRL
jgi:hypothetical protein